MAAGRVGATLGYNLDELARRFDRSVSWVSRRLALVEVLPQAIQQQVREGQILAQVALKFLVPVARQSLENCVRMAAIFAQHQEYFNVIRDSRVARVRILFAPWLVISQSGSLPTSKPPSGC